MKRFPQWPLIVVAGLMSLIAGAQTPVKISALPVSLGLVNSDILPVTQTGTNCSGLSPPLSSPCTTGATGTQFKTFVGSLTSVSFTSVLAGTNTNALVVGAGGTLNPSGGIINANQVNGASEPVSAAVVATNSSGQHVAATTTGSGSTVVLATSPTLVTPALGTPTALVLTSATALPPATGLASGNLPSGVKTNGGFNPIGNVVSGTSALGTALIASGACASTVTTTATGTATTDVVNWGFNANVSGVTGYAPATAGMLVIEAYPTANNVNFVVCNNTANSVTPGAVTLNWQILR